MAEVCKFFLCGFCPHYLFTNTRADLGRCVKVHDEDYRASYQKSSRFEKMGYEEEFSKFLLALISDVDKRIRRGEQRLVLNSQPTPIPTTAEMAAREKRVKQLSERITKLVEEAESLGCEGNVDLAQNVMVLCEKLRDERTTLIDLNATEMRQLESANEPTKAMEVCATCGALLVIGDPHQRLDEHVSGKQHKGFAQIRSYLSQRQLSVSEQTVETEQTASSSSDIAKDDELSSRAYDGLSLPVVASEACSFELSGCQNQEQLHYYRNDFRSHNHESRMLSRHRSRSGDKSHSSSRHSASPHRHKHRHRHSSRHHSSSVSRHSRSSHKQSRESQHYELTAEDLLSDDC